VPLFADEAAAAAALAFLASTIVSAYIVDWCGLRIVPAAILLVSLAAAFGVAAQLGRTIAERRAERHTTWIFVAIVGGTLGWLLWLARPGFLPTGSGPDLVQHLALIEYIQEHWRLVHDVRLSEYLGEMVDYTPGVHLLVALVGAWIPAIDALHVVYPVVAFTVALKAGLVFLIARRLMRDEAAREPFAIAAVLLLLTPRIYSVGSFTEQSYLAQVVSELFAVAAWWTIVIWDERPSPGPMRLFALFVAACFLVWPVWLGPVLILLAGVALAHRRVPLAERIRQIAPASAAVLAIAAMHSVRHAGGFRIAGTGGFAIPPTMAVVGWPFFAASAASLAACALHRRTRTVTMLAAAIALQAAALYVAARRSGAAAPYLAIKMFYLAIYPMAVAIALTAADVWRAAEVWRAAAGWMPRLRPAASARTTAAAIAIFGAWPAIAAPRPKPVVTEPVLQAAVWARDHAPRDCIDYLTQDGYTAYWLHLAVFGNPRASGRATDDDTFEPKKALVRWILPGGLPYAVTDDFNALPRDIRESVDVLARFDRAAVVRRRGTNAARCR